MRQTKAKTTGVTVNARVETRDAFSKFCADRGDIQADLLGRLLDWFMSLDPTTRLLVVSKLDARDRVAVAKIALERIIAGEETPEEPIRKIDVPEGGR